MIYGLYLSATGVLTNSYRQDVIANNLANAQTVGFKRSMALFEQRPTEAQASPGDARTSEEILEGIGGGMLLAPTAVDFSQGLIEQTGQPLDAAVHGRGFFAVRDGAETRLTRNGRFLIDADGYLALADGARHRVLDPRHNPIPLGGALGAQVAIGPDGSITSADGQVVGQLGLFDVPDVTRLTLKGETLMSYAGDAKSLPRADGTIESGFLESANVDPMTELTQLIAAQRQLEANANMIRFQDQTLSKLVNEVGKIG